jgi:hypothetical protein
VNDTQGKSATRRLTWLLLMLAAVAVLWWFLRPGNRPPLPPVASPSTTANTIATTRDATAPTQFDFAAIDNPAADGWDSEVFADAAGGQLKHIGKLLEHPEQLDEHALIELRDVLADDFQCGPLRPTDLHCVHQSDALTIERAAAQDEQPGDQFSDAEGLLAALRQYAQPLQNLTDPHHKFKVYRVIPHDGGIATIQYFSISGSDGDGSFEINATWRCEWRHDGDGPPRLRSIAVMEHEQARATPAKGSRTLFVDCTGSAIERTDRNAELLGRGLPYWSVRIEYMFGQGPMGYNGLAIGDANGDGLEDLYVCNPGGIPNQLFVQNPDGTLTDRAPQMGVDILDATGGALFVDLDNDGDQDMAIGTLENAGVLENDGEGHFIPRSAFPNDGVPMSIVAADYDNDADLDLYITYYAQGMPLPYHDANNGPPNVLWRNDGGWKFIDATASSGLDADNRRFSFAAAWEDVDNDGDMDLYVANDFGRNCLYRNDGGRFTNVAADAGVEDISAGMSVTFGDVNHDGFMDLHVSNMFSSAGNRITYQRQFNPGAEGDNRDAFQRHARGDSLFVNHGDDTFTDRSVESGITMGRWAWTSLLRDINNDTFDDIVVANGNITHEDTKDL